MYWNGWKFRRKVQEVRTLIAKLCKEVHISKQNRILRDDEQGLIMCLLTISSKTIESWNIYLDEKYSYFLTYFWIVSISIWKNKYASTYSVCFVFDVV